MCRLVITVVMAVIMVEAIRAITMTIHRVCIWAEGRRIFAGEYASPWAMTMIIIMTGDTVTIGTIIRSRVIIARIVLWRLRLHHGNRPLYQRQGQGGGCKRKQSGGLLW